MDLSQLNKLLGLKPNDAIDDESLNKLFQDRYSSESSSIEIDVWTVGCECKVRHSCSTEQCKRVLKWMADQSLEWNYEFQDHVCDSHIKRLCANHRYVLDTSAMNASIDNLDLFEAFDKMLGYRCKVEHLIDFNLIAEPDSMLATVINSLYRRGYFKYPKFDQFPTSSQGCQRSSVVYRC